MTTQPNPGEGVPKERPARHSLNTLETTLAPAFGAKRAKDAVQALRAGGYFDRSLMQQVEMAIQSIAGACTSGSERTGVLRALKESPSDRMRGYAAGVAYQFFSDEIARCVREIVAVGILPGISAQESGQMYLKRLMQQHGTETVRPFCEDLVSDSRPEARRLLIEALRPRGVWTGHLNDLRENPKPLKPILEKVLDDPSDYVRKAVANCINDISKDHPELVCRWTKQWWKKRMSPERAWILKRGLRTLVKSGHPGALELMGFGSVPVQVTWDGAFPGHIRPGESIPIALSVRNMGGDSAGVHVQIVLTGPGRGRAPRRTTYQVAQSVVAPGVVTEIAKNIPFRHRNSQPKLPGRYHIELHVNGAVEGTRSFVYED